MSEGLRGFHKPNPEKALLHAESKLDFNILASKFYPQAEQAVGNIALISLVSEKLEEIVTAGDEYQEDVCRQLARDHGKFFPDTIEDEKSRAAYALALAHTIDNERRRKH